MIILHGIFILMAGLICQWSILAQRKYLTETSEKRIDYIIANSVQYVRIDHCSYYRSLFVYIEMSLCGSSDHGQRIVGELGCNNSNYELV